ncbi:MAG TPA: hypothetical protein VKF36_10320 [Syntrophorhabdales bacterium]|nr:hypothetical protein [Syntrophorhabdales bacterium]
MRRKYQGKLLMLMLIGGLVAISGCAGYDRTKGVGCSPARPGDACEKQPDENQRPAWFYISPPGTW